MRICQTHFKALKEKVIDKGMGALISYDGVAAHERMAAEMEGTATNATYDPLLAACWMLMGMALERGGFYLLGSKPGDSSDGEYCPLCEVEAAGVKLDGKAGAAEEWLEGSTDCVLIYCRENNLLARPQ